MLGEVLNTDMFDKLRQLESFREYEAKVIAEGKAEANARVAEANARVAEADAAITARNLKDFLVLRGDAPSKHALSEISACKDPDVLDAWLKRAYLGETAAQLFPEPKPPAD